MSMNQEGLFLSFRVIIVTALFLSSSCIFGFSPSSLSSASITGSTHYWSSADSSLFPSKSRQDITGAIVGGSTIRAMTASQQETTPVQQRETQNPDELYTAEQLKDALASLSVTGGASSSQHIYGYDDPNHELSMLQKVTATRILDYQKLMPSLPKEEELEKMAADFAKEHGPILNIQKVIQGKAPAMALAAEFKRASPSKGPMASIDKSCGEQAVQYATAGASMISILTEPHWFIGSLQDMTDARLDTTQLLGPEKRPAILRKEFVTNRYMILEAAAGGADTILLIVATLPADLLEDLITYARSLGMEPLVEVHAGVELDVALGAGARVIGVNNRNLHTFQMNLSTTSDTAAELARRGLSFHHGGEEATPEYTICALSGMSSSSDVHRYRQCGVAMCLIGESLMRAADPKAAIASLCLDPADYETSNDTIATAVGSAYTAGTKLVKVCGITNPEDALVACRASANLIGIIFAAKSKRCIQSVEQGRAIVQAVREFGERTDRVDILANYDNENESKRSPLEALVRKSKLLQEAARRPLVVGVFQNQDSSFIADMVEQCGLDLVQLHGKEGMAAANPKMCGGVPALRVVDIETKSASSDETDQEDTESDPTKRILEALTSDPLAILLDTSIKGDKSGGGTGVTFDWTIAETLQNNGLPVLIAGGLQAENVEKAVSSVRPWGVDVSSGVEASPGQKNHQQVTAFCTNVRHAAKEASKGF